MFWRVIFLIFLLAAFFVVGTIDYDAVRATDMFWALVSQ
jgi:hypothetical protein